VCEVELDRRLYEGLVQRASAEADQAAPAADARVISEAVPPTSPSFPKPRLLASLGGTVGLALALFLVYLLESSDRGFAGPDEVQEGLALPTLALVPELPASSSGPAPQDYPLEKPRSRYAEALRDILAALQLDPHAGGPGQVVLLTSVLPDEGKSTLALSLGRLGVAEGLRVLVIDADLRRPSIHALAGLRPGPGLIELLRGEVPPEEVIHTDPRSSGLHILASSGRLSQPTRFLTPDRLGRVFQVVRTRFDLVIVDAAPLAAVADPRLLAPLADKTLLLIRHASTRRELCLPMLASLRATGATIAGVVLSRTDLRRYQDTTRYRLGAAQASLARYYAD
jgi:Mrp family chromosome partitioning ATPase